MKRLPNNLGKIKDILKYKRKPNNKNVVNNKTLNIKRAPLNIQQLEKLWWWCFITTPLDILIIGAIYEGYLDLIHNIPRHIAWLTLLVGGLLMLAPIIKEKSIQLLISSQGIQHDAIKIRAQLKLISYLIFYIIILVDLCYRIFHSFGSIASITIGIIGLILIPAWLKFTIQNQTEDQIPILKEGLKERLDRSALQMDSLMLFFQVMTRLGSPISLIAIYCLSASSTALATCLIASLISQLAMKPVRDDIFSICRKCGLWSRRAHQFDSLCPGCTALRLKSYIYSPDRENHFIKIIKPLEKLEKSLEGRVKRLPFSR